MGDAASRPDDARRRRRADRQRASGRMLVGGKARVLVAEEPGVDLQRGPVVTLGLAGAALEGAGLLLFMLGDAVYLLYGIRDAEMPFPSVADVLYPAGYPVLGVKGTLKDGKAYVQVGGGGMNVNMNLVRPLFGNASVVLLEMTMSPRAPRSPACGSPTCRPRPAPVSWPP